MFEQNQQPLPQHDNDESRHGDGSFLYIRYKNDRVNPDKGNRPPGGLPPGTVFWKSTDIVVSPVDTFGNVQVGTDVTVQARIFNGGEVDALCVHVEFWWFNPTLAFTAAPANQQFGTKIVNVGRNSYREVECPSKWRPNFVNGGHECLVVQCSSPSEGTRDLKFPFAAALDRHVGQKNLTVSPNAPGQKLQLIVGNPFQSPELFTVYLSTLLISVDMDEFRTLDVREAMGFLAGAAANQKPTSARNQRLRLEVTDITQRELGVHLARERKIKRYGEGQQGDDLERYINARARSDPDFNPATLGRSLVEFLLQSTDARVLDFDLPPVDMGSGHFLVHHLTQVVAGYDVGGYTVVVPPVDFGRHGAHVPSNEY